MIPQSPKRRNLKGRSKDFLHEMSVDLFKQRLRDLFFKEWQATLVDLQRKKTKDCIPSITSIKNY